MMATWVLGGKWVYAADGGGLAWPALRILTGSNTGKRNGILEGGTEPQPGTRSWKLECTCRCRRIDVDVDVDVDVDLDR